MSSNNTPTPPGAPISFKTVPGRHRTQKWNKAANYSYDGDDWGGYDDYDDDGGGAHEEQQRGAAPPPMPAHASQLPSQQGGVSAQRLGQRPSQELRQPPPPQQGISRPRTHSFDQGDDGARSVSAPFPAGGDRRGVPGSAASAGRGSKDLPRSSSRPRDFTNPEHAPPPLHTTTNSIPRGAPAPAEWFPPRRSSLSTGSDYGSQAAAEEARAIAQSVTNPTGGLGTASSPATDKPLPFIRPSDIYKRIPEEMKRQSEEGGRPSLDSLQRVKSGDAPNLTPVHEARESTLFTNSEAASAVGEASRPAAVTQTPAKDTSPTLPEVSRFSGFGDDFLGSTNATGASTQPPALNTAIDRSATTLSSLQNTPTTTRPAAGHDTAAEILAERQQKASAVDLQHQPSVGFRSAVNQAFDEPALSRDSSQSTPASGSGVGRSDTSSTAGVSPIMSRVPSAATAAFRQQQRDEQVPSITEESTTTPTGSRPMSETTLTGMHAIPRKPSPGHSRNTSADHGPPQGFESGYRRSLDPPSNGTSPARTPGVESVAGRRLSTPLSAVLADGDAPDVSDQGAEIAEPKLHQDTVLTTAPLPITGRGRSGTDYSLREADIAEQINSSPDKTPQINTLGHAAKNSQEVFLQTHNVQTPTSPLTPGGGRAASPAKGRVREIADKYDQASRRNSAASIGSNNSSSWSKFGDDEDKPKLKRAGTSHSNLGNEVRSEEHGTGRAPPRPQFGREESFKPDLPGAWQSEAPTPALESPPVQPGPSGAPIGTDLTRSETPVDLTPTTKRYQLQESSPVDALRNAGSALAASMVSTHGVGHQTRDFASKEPPAPVDQPEFAPRAATGMLQPPLLRHETNQSSEPPTSVASSIPPTPPSKDTPRPGDESGLAPQAGYFGGVAPLRVRSREPSPEHQDSPEIPADNTLNAASRPHHLSHVSSSTTGSEQESDRLHQEIVRSLETSTEDVERTQDALDASENQRRVNQGQPPLPGAETAAAGAVAAASSSTKLPPKPGLLDTRFSWESKPAGHTAPEPKPKSPEVYPEMAYERPRSKQLHIMNPGDVSPDTPIHEIPPTHPAATSGPLGVPDVRGPEAAAAETEITRSLSQRGRGLKTPGTEVSPITRSQEHLIPETSIGPGSPSQSLREMAPSPISNDGASARIPSYYASASGQDVPFPPEKDSTNAASMPLESPSPGSRPKNPGGVNIPPFRSILAMKTSDERIRTYNDTRKTFADMNTGLDEWLIAMTHKHPDVSVSMSDSPGAFKPPPLQTQLSSGGTASWKRGHRASPSLANFKQRFASASSANVDAAGRQNSVGGSTLVEGDSSHLYASDTASGKPTTPGGGIDVEKMQAQMQQRGKDIMKGASVLGGKTAAGAKGLFAKGRSKWGGSVRKPGGGEG